MNTIHSPALKFFKVGKVYAWTLKTTHIHLANSKLSGIELIDASTPLMFVGYQDANDILPFLERQEREPMAVFLGNNGEWCLLRSQATKAAKLIEVQPC